MKQLIDLFPLVNASFEYLYSLLDNPEAKTTEKIESCKQILSNALKWREFQAKYDLKEIEKILNELTMTNNL